MPSISSFSIRSPSEASIFRRRYTKVFSPESSRRSASSLRPVSGASCAAVFTGSLMRNGWAKTVTESSETASSTPFRSTIVPRRAGSAMSSICWLTARSDSDPDFTVPSHVARSAAMVRAIRKRAKSRPMRRSTRRIGGRPLPRRERRGGGGGRAGGAGEDPRGGAGGGQHEPERRRRLLDPLARGEACHVEPVARDLALQRRDLLGVARDLAVHLEEVDVEEHDAREQDEHERDPPAPRE